MHLKFFQKIKWDSIPDFIKKHREHVNTINKAHTEITIDDPEKFCSTEKMKEFFFLIDLKFTMISIISCIFQIVQHLENVSLIMDVQM